MDRRIAGAFFVGGVLVEGLGVPIEGGTLVNLIGGGALAWFLFRLFLAGQEGRLSDLKERIVQQTAQIADLTKAGQDATTTHNNLVEAHRNLQSDHSELLRAYLQVTGRAFVKEPSA